MERISVIIPTTGKRQTLIDAIASVYDQINIDTFSIEVIVVNDGNLLEVDLTEFLDKDNFRIVDTGGFKGANFARNMGVDFTNSDWISFLDDDDLWHASKLKYQFKYRNENTVLFCKKKFFSDSVQRIERVSKFHTGNLYIYNYVGSTSSIFLSRAVFIKAGGFRIDLPALQDWDFYIRLEKAGARFENVKETYIYYRLTPKGRISTNMSRQFRAVVLLMIKGFPRPLFLIGLIFHLSRIICRRLLFRY